MLDLPADLLIEAKTLAARRRTTLKAIVESALRRKIRPANELENPDPEKFDVDPLRFLVLKRRPGETITPEQIQAIQDELDDEEFQRAIQPTPAFAIPPKKFKNREIFHLFQTRLLRVGAELG